MYQNYIFDLYGTLIDNDTDETSKTFFKKFTKWLRRNGYMFHYKEFMYPYLEIEQKYRQRESPYQYPEIAIEPVFQEVFALRDYTLCEKELKMICENFRRISTRKMQLYPDTIHCMEALKEAGKNIYLLSNAQRSYTMPELEATGLLSYFDGVLISSDEGCMKPDPEFFEILFQRYGLDKQKSIMIGNELSSDIAGAVAAGIDSLYINRYPTFHEREDAGYTYVSEHGGFDLLLDKICGCIDE